MINTEPEHLTIYGAATAGIITLVYKFYRMIRSDRSSDQISNEEQNFRNMLNVEIKELKENNQKLLIEKSELTSKISALDVRVEFMNKEIVELRNCRNCPLYNQNNPPPV